MHDFEALAASYIDTWNERDPAARSAAIGKLWADDARYTDPLMDVRGREAVSAAIGAAQEQFPGFTFRLAGPIDGHHDQCRFSWELGPAGGEAPVAGFDVAVVTDDGTLQTVLGFLDRVPAS
jgi:SnoaL-like domain